MRRLDVAKVGRQAVFCIPAQRTAQSKYLKHSQLLELCTISNRVVGHHIRMLLGQGKSDRILSLSDVFARMLKV